MNACRETRVAEAAIAPQANTIQFAREWVKPSHATRDVAIAKLTAA